MQKILKYSAALAALLAAATLAAQEAPTNPKTADGDNLERIHSSAFLGTRLRLKNANIWSQQQCQSCHAGAHTNRAVAAERFLLTTATVANSLGIETAPLDGTLRAHLNIAEKSGLVLSSVPEGSEGAKAGLKQHDVVLTVDQQPVSDPAKFNELLGTLGGKKAHFGLLRQGKPQTLELTVPQMPLAKMAELPLTIFDRSSSYDLAFAHGLRNDDRYRIGVTLSEADETLRSHLKLPASEGLVVTEVVDGSPAAKMGVKQNDVLIELDGKKLTTVEAINTQIQEIKDKTVLLRLLRSAQEVTCQIAPKKSAESAQMLNDLVLIGDQGHHPAIVRWLSAIDQGQAPSGDAAAQIAELKKQLAELNKTVEKLEAVIAPPALPAEEKKPEEQDKK